MTTYTQFSHPLDIAAGIRDALSIDDIRFMLSDVLPGQVLDAITGWMAGEYDRQEKEIERLNNELDSMSVQSEDFIDQREELEQRIREVESERDTAIDNFKACDALLAEMEVKHQHCAG